MKKLNYIHFTLLASSALLEAAIASFSAFSILNLFPVNFFVKLFNRSFREPILPFASSVLSLASSALPVTC